jgi:flagellar biosynthesis/type III secretory pathway chaperone
MTPDDLTELLSVLEQEVAVGRELERNLAAQKSALIAWDIDKLLQEIGGREPWVRALAVLESKRAQALAEIRTAGDCSTLRGLISQLALDTPERSRMTELREATREVFNRIAAEERHLHNLMHDILCHLHDALRPLADAPAGLYSESGAAAAGRAPASLIHNRA